MSKKQLENTIAELTERIRIARLLTGESDLTHRLEYRLEDLQAELEAVAC